MPMCVFARCPPQFFDCSRVRLSWHTVLYQSKNAGPSPVCWWDIYSFLVHFNFSRREKERCSGLFLFCPHKMGFQDESSVLLFWLWQTARIVFNLSGFGAFGQTSPEFCSGGNSYCHLQQVGRPCLFQAMLKKRLWWSSHGEGRCLMSRFKNVEIALRSRVCVCVCEREEEGKSLVKV
ncbi:hypothetical protein ILYODFUR_034459 [Ilyodon furcidens]|uniref:Uncharacterized protein n=1 Tax=Ilyodon furcidens TaxID=33524 RepID=A0ABV0TER8_9TELE